MYLANNSYMGCWQLPSASSAPAKVRARTRRGSVMIFAVILTTSLTSVVVATVWLCTSLVKDERIREDRTRMFYASEGATEQAAQDYANGTLTLPTTRTVAVNGVSCALTITDNNANNPHTMVVQSVATYHGRTYTFTKTVGERKLPSPFYYALYVATGMTYAGNLNTGASGINGDVYVGGALTLTSLSTTINGDLESSGLLSISTASVTGTSYPSSTSIPFPTVTATNYSTVANQTTSSGSISSTSFSTTTGNYYLIYDSNTSVNISGTFTGKGTIFCKGNVTITGPVTVANSSSRVAIICAGTLTFSSGGPHSAYFYAPTISPPLLGLTITKGGLVCNSLSTLTSPMTITNDPAVWNDSTEGTKHRLPGFFP